MKSEKTLSSKSRRAKSSHVLLLNCLCSHMQTFGYECDYLDSYSGSCEFHHYDGTKIDFANARQLMEFIREASHRKTYRR